MLRWSSTPGSINSQTISYLFVSVPLSVFFLLLSYWSALSFSFFPFFPFSHSTILLYGKSGKVRTCGEVRTWPFMSSLETLRRSLSSFTSYVPFGLFQFIILRNWIELFQRLNLYSHQWAHTLCPWVLSELDVSYRLYLPGISLLHVCFVWNCLFECLK